MSTTRGFALLQLFAALALSAPASAPRAAERLEEPAVQLVTLPPPDEFLEEHFVLRGEFEEALGVMLLRRTRQGNEHLIEWTLELTGAVRESWVERIGPEQCRLVWRENLPGVGRSLTLERQGEELRLAEWGREVVRSVLDAPQSALLPLSLVELLRAGDPPLPELFRFDPLSSSLERLSVEIAGEGELRSYRLLRLDGSQALSLEFRGRALERCGFAPGGPSLCRVAEQDFVRIRVQVTGAH